MPDANQQQAAHSQHFTRSQTRLHYKAAGVLPFAFQHGTPVVLLGAEAVKTGPEGKITKTMWRDFGGQREAIDTDSESTASREFAEETMGLFGGCDVNGNCVAACTSQMHAQLSCGQNVLKVVHQLKKGEYHMYITETPHIDPLMFHLALQQNDETDAVSGAEKTAFAWVALSDLLQATVTCAKRYFLYAHAHTTGNRRQPVFHGLRRMQLHPCFASSLRLAQNAGLMSLVAAAQAASVVQHSIEESDTQIVMTERPRAFYTEQLDAACCVNTQNDVHDAVMQTVCSQPVLQTRIEQQTGRPHRIPAAALVGAAQQCGSHIQGLTPEHMLYWVSQADVAQQLRSSQQQDAATASAEVLANQQSGGSIPETSCPMDIEASPAVHPSAANIRGTDCATTGEATALTETSAAETAACQQQRTRRAMKQKAERRSGSVRKAGRKQSCA